MTKASKREKRADLQTDAPTKEKASKAGTGDVAGRAAVPPANISTLIVFRIRQPSSRTPGGPVARIVTRGEPSRLLEGFDV